MKDNEYYKIFRAKDDGEVYITRLEFPRFVAKYTPGGEISDFEFENFIDIPPSDPTLMARIMREIGEVILDFLKDEQR